MQTFTVVSLLIALLLAGCTATQDSASDNPLLNELTMLTGKDAKPCGMVALGQKPDAAWACAQEADKRDSAYWIAIELEGVDSDIWHAAMRTPSGQYFVLEYDSNHMGAPGLLPRFKRDACETIDMRSRVFHVIFRCLRIINGEFTRQVQHPRSS